MMKPVKIYLYIIGIALIVFVVIKTVISFNYQIKSENDIFELEYVN